MSHEREERHAARDEREHERGGAAAELDEREREQATEEEKVNAAVTHEVIRREGTKELDRTPSALAWSGLAAGLSMGLSLVAEAVLHHALPETPWRPVVAKLGYSVGFLVVILGSQQLYTENTLTPIVPLMSKRTGEMLRKVLVLWGVVLLANLVGAALFAWATARTTVLPSEIVHAMTTVARESVAPGALDHFARGIAAGWIIALLVWMLPAASASQVVVIILMTWLVGAARLSHVIVGSIEAFFLVALGDLGAMEALGRYTLPSLIGNTLGGVTLVAMINHAQVEAG
jgi:formate/nitrite transporter FocA (FNT family)